MRYNIINIVGNDKKFRYFFEYLDDVTYVGGSNFDYTFDNNVVTFTNTSYDNMLQRGNYWVDIKETSKLHLPTYINISNLRVYFPNFSLETYEKLVKYNITIKIWMNEQEVNLGSFLVDRLNSVACEKPVVFLNDNYYEYIDLMIPDPWYIMYGDEWKEWRIYNIYKPKELQVLEGKELSKFIKEYPEYNDESANIIVQFHPVEMVNNTWTKSTVYEGGQNYINWRDIDTNNLRVLLTTNTKKSNDGASVQVQLKFNKAYNDLKSYLQETYNMNNPKIQVEVVAKDSENIYKYVSKEDTKSTKYTFTKEEIGFTSWSEYVDGMKFYSIVTLYDLDDAGGIISSLQLNSNEVFLDKEQFKFFVSRYSLNNVDLNKMTNMQNYKFNVVNKVQKNIVQVARPQDYKSNVIMPVFFRTQELSSIILHSSVTENIALNLDDYKNKVEIFYLNVGGTLFQEIGRTNQGVIFKVVGQKLDKSQKTGNYYILNENQEMVTFGEYTIK